MTFSLGVLAASIAQAQVVAALGADFGSYRTDVVDALVASGEFDSVVEIDLVATVPTDADLDGFDAVLVWSDLQIQDSETVGDRLADAVDEGMGLVVAVFGSASGLEIRGRLKSGGYNAILVDSVPLFGSSSAWMVPLDAGHPILDGVVDFYGGNDSIRTDAPEIAPGANRVADWSDGDVLVSEHVPSGAGRVVGLNLFPPSSRAAPDLWDASTDGAVLIANALAFAAWPDADGDGWLRSSGDCDDHNPLVYPLAEDYCNGLDDNCDGVLLVDDVDADHDGWAVCAGDCADFEPLRFPGAVELCDGLDNDCDVSTVEDADADGDEQGWCAGDCDDADASVFLGAPELCDGRDNDCDPLTDEESDDDGDGVRLCDDRCEGGDDGNDPDEDGVPTHCDPCPMDALDDSDGDTVCDSDDRCPGVDDALDADGDGAPESCDVCPGVRDPDQTDVDGDGWGAACDCHDLASEVFPGAVEVCDGLDNDCDGLVDPDGADGGVLVYADVDGDGAGDPGSAYMACEVSIGSSAVGTDCNDLDAFVRPGAVERCDGVDQNCDRQVDEGCTDPQEPASCGCAASPGPGSLVVPWLILSASMWRRRGTRLR